MMGDLLLSCASLSHDSFRKTYISDADFEVVQRAYPHIKSKIELIEEIIMVGIDTTDEDLLSKKTDNTLEIDDETYPNISHELKTPLNLIYSASQLLDLYIEKDSLDEIDISVTRSNQTINKNCYRLEKLINNILDVSKLETGSYNLKLGNYNMVDVMDNIIDSVVVYTKGSDLEITFDTEVEDMIIALDIYELKRIMLNLISNAIKFSSPHSKISVKLVGKNKIAEIIIEDNGIGIGKEKFAIIFKQFVRLNTSLTQACEGAGMGLFIVDSLIKLHGGSVNLESVLGKGSIFKIELPIITVDIVSGHENQYNEIVADEITELELSDIYL